MANKAGAKKPVAKKAGAKPPARKAAAKRPAAKQPAKKATPKQSVAKAAAKKPAAIARPTKKAAPANKPVASKPPDPVLADWRATLRAELAATGEDFGAYLRGLDASGWEFADSPELAGLEQWGTALAKRDRMAGIGALVRAAQHGFPIAAAAGGIGLEGMGFLASEEAMDGAPVETQIALAAAWLDAPDAPHLRAVTDGNDPSRQLQVWDDDLRPSDDRAHWWYMDVGQCCGHAITQRAGDPKKHSYYDWPPETCVGRGLVLAVRGLRDQGADLAAILRDVRAAMVA